MLRVHVKEPSSEWGDHNPYMIALETWQAWGRDMGLTWLPGGSERQTIEPGQWFIKSYDRANRSFRDGRNLCFHEDDRALAIIFKLTWGGK